MKKLLIIIIYAVLLSACATQGQQAKTEGTTGGAAIGALTGALIGGLAGGNWQSAAIGAGAGAVAGGVGGYFYADNIVKSNQELQAKEVSVDDQIRIAKDINSQLQAGNQDAEKKLAQFNQDITSLNSQTKSQASRQKKLAATKQKINEEQINVQKNLDAAKTSLSELEKKRTTNSSQSADLDAQVLQLKTTYSELQQKSNALASLSQRI
jgi:outer membrane lipoprotein SlyB